MEPIISLHGINKGYSTAHARVDVLSGFHLEVMPGEFVALMGPSGVGKSTILNLIGAMDSPDQGTVTVAGTRIEALSESARSRWRACHIGFVFQSHFLMPMLTAAANVELPLMLTSLSRNGRRTKVAQVLEQVGLADRVRHKPAELSGGQQQRVGIARALVAGAPVLLCDEPTAGLDRQTADSILSLLSDLSRNGRTIVMVTHDQQAAAFAGRKVELSTMAASS
ncbi:MAG TPA: ABC transporter ATP-binding protein [Rhizomicrobium sp.]|jgi:putative ABC transport system ATP-binding protein|nr:ABC transporter ATP-binding protein [Rhizomicrobium sp.]